MVFECDEFCPTADIDIRKLIDELLRSMPHWKMLKLTLFDQKGELLE